jgi:hypothetical protein
MKRKFCPQLFLLFLSFPYSFLISENNGQRRFSSTFLGFDQNLTLISAVDDSFQGGDFNGSLKSNLENFYGNMTGGQYLAAYDYTLNYLLDAKDRNQTGANSISDDALTDAVGVASETLFKAASNNGAVDNTFLKNASRILLENFITDPLGLQGLNTGVSDRVNKLSKQFFSSISALSGQNDLADGISSFYHSVLSLYLTGNANGVDFNQTDFTPGVELVTKNDLVESEIMKFGGVPQFYNFDPLKTNIVNNAALGLSQSFLEAHFSNQSQFDSNTSGSFDVFTESILRGVYDFAVDIGSENEDFILEILKSTTSGVLTGSTGVIYSDSNITFDQAIVLSEELSYSLSNYGIKLASENNLAGIEYNDIAEAISFGVAMGGHSESAISKINPQLSNPYIMRKLLSKALSAGSSQGALTAIANLSANDVNVGWEEIKMVSSQSAKGSMVANVANVIYFGEDEELLPIINFSAQGASYGATSTLALNNVEKPQGLTEDLTVEIARTSSHGSSLGATFTTVGIKGGNPVTNENDNISNKTVQAVAYGATIGSILGASESGNGDPIIVKQAAKQGVTEGSLIGSGFATDYRETFFVDNDIDDMELAAKKNMITSITRLNADASLEAMNSLATKKVKTSSRDMLLLIRKFNISPNTTNPATIFQRPTKKKSADDFPFEDKFPAATPI